MKSIALHAGVLSVTLAVLLLAAPSLRAEDKPPSSLTSGEALYLGKVAFDKKRYRVAYLYFARALSADPSSGEARTRAIEALHYARKYSSREEMTEKEQSLPPVPSELEAEFQAAVQRRFGGGETGEKQPAIPIPEDRTDESAGEGREEWIPEEEKPRDPVDRPSERPEMIKPGLTTVLGIATRISLAPLSTTRADFFHALVHVPPFEGARTLDEKVWYAEMGYEYCIGSLESGRFGPGTTDLVFRYLDNAYHEGYIKVAHGLLEGFDVRAVLSTANLREGDGDLLLTDFGTTPNAVYIEDYNRRADVGNLVVSGKWNFSRTLFDWPSQEAESGLTGIFDIKIPLARNPKNFTSSGGFDVAASICASYYFGKLIFFPMVGHASVGATLPLGQRYFSENVDLDPIFSFAIGADMKFANFGVLIAQIQGNTSAFTEFSPLKGMVMTTHLGLRLMIGHFFLESSIGFPLTTTSSTFTFSLHFGLHFMGKEREEEILT